MITNEKKIIIISGDPNSINSELIYKCWKKLSKKIKRNIYIISNFDLLKKQFSKLGYSVKLSRVDNIDEEVSNDNLKIINIDLDFNYAFNVPFKSSSKFVIKSLEKAHKLALRKDVMGIINCAIDKKLLSNKNYGVTEYLSKKCKVKNQSEVMLIFNKNLSVAPVTTHVDIKKISKILNKNLIYNKIKTIDNFFKKSFKIKPNIGVMGLNPHNAELRKNSEEVKIIIPIIKKLKKNKIKVKGPLISDTLFISEYKKYNVIVGMFHDQVLAPFKTLFKFDAINITIGLKYLRVSPDHGTARKLILKKIANPLSLFRCIKFILKFGKMKKAKKSLGQNFLIDKNIINKILSLTKIKDRNIVEIGPGKGALTDEIIKKKPKTLLIIEKDNLLFDLLIEKYSKFKYVKVVNADILKFDLEKNIKSNSIIFGNLPYNISSQILVKLIKFEKWPPKFSNLILMFQKELGEKIMGKFPSSKYGRLSIISNFRLENIEKFIVSENCFFPKPKVKSMVINFKPKKYFQN